MMTSTRYVNLFLGTTLAKLSSKRNILLVLTLFSGLWFVGNSSYIHAKATLAQLLLETAWTNTLHGEQEVKPWPWADTWPVARLSAPRLGINHIVLAGASGATLAFGPGHLFNSSQPGTYGNVVISGHRDTHFAFLEELRDGDSLLLETRGQQRRHYTVRQRLVVNKDTHPFIPATNNDQLMLITCYPFNAVRAGGPLRYVVIAEAEPVVMT